MRHYIPPFATARFHISSITLEYKGSSPLPSISVGMTTPLVVGGLHPLLTGRQSVHPSQFYSPRFPVRHFSCLASDNLSEPLCQAKCLTMICCLICAVAGVFSGRPGFVGKEEYSSVVYGSLETGMELCLPKVVVALRVWVCWSHLGVLGVQHILNNHFDHRPQEFLRHLLQ
jgi:hypothetical protein